MFRFLCSSHEHIHIQQVELRSTRVNHVQTSIIELQLNLTGDKARNRRYYQRSYENLFLERLVVL